MDTRSISLVETTSSDLDTLQRIGEKLVETRLAACIQILPAHQSIYRWEGKVVQSTEYRLHAKTILSLVPQVIQSIKSQHPYQLPEIAHCSVSVTEEFAKWVSQETDNGSAR